MKKSRSLFSQLIQKVGRTPDKSAWGCLTAAGQHCCRLVETKTWRTNLVWSTSFVENASRPKSLCVLSAIRVKKTV
ncbi:MAG: hypothetical protein PHQ35_01285 [Phycisphaerae bacterium]|nr:hypothetical protein [Phycisphaerae bacterium]MDD5381741.1 hypothetical protein [Phycisphaerae bacterium]